MGGFFSSYSYQIRSGAPYVPGLLPLAGTTDLDFIALPLTIKQEAGFAHVSYELSRSLKIKQALDILAIKIWPHPRQWGSFLEGTYP